MAQPVRRVALVAHDNCKKHLITWVSAHVDTFRQCELVTTGTTGRLIEDATGLKVNRVKSGPLGGDQQIGAMIAENKIDMLVFFWDPLEPMSHDPDIKALLRLATLWNIPLACNESSADFLLASPCFQAYDRRIPDFSGYVDRPMPG